MLDAPAALPAPLGEPLAETRYCRIGKGDEAVFFACTLLSTGGVQLKLTACGGLDTAKARALVVKRLGAASSAIKGPTAFYLRTVRNRLDGGTPTWI